MSQRCLDFDQNIESRDVHAPSNAASGSRSRMPVGIGLHLNSLGAFPALSRQQSSETTKTQADISPAESEHLLGSLDEEEIQFGTAESPSVNATRSSRKRPSSERQTTEARAPKRRRKPEGSCKRCSCKKSRCLKLYCECFASGSYCLDSCICRDCSNKPEFEGVVAEVRSLIKSRNPLAFAPRVVPTEPADAETLEGSASKHKRGCNCKKSMCLKKYCECYQSEVGCSTSCKCVGCKNTFGPKQVGEELDTVTPRDAADTGHSFFVESPASPALLRAISAITSEDVVYNVGGRDIDSSPLQPASTCSKSSSNFHTFGTPVRTDTQLSPESRTGTPEPQRRMNFVKRLPPGIHSLQSRSLDADSPAASLDDGAAAATAGADTPEFLLDASEVQSETAVPATTTTTTSSPKKKRVQVVKSSMNLPPLIKNGRKLTLQALPSLPSVSSLRENSLKASLN